MVDKLQKVLTVALFIFALYNLKNGTMAWKIFSGIVIMVMSVKILMEDYEYGE